MTRTKLASLRTHLLAGLEWMSLGLGGLLLAITVWDVIGRYLFGRPLFGAPEMVQYLMGAFVFCGLGLVSARDRHVAVDIFAPRLAEAFPHLTRFTIGFFTLAGLSVIAWQLGKSGLDALARDKSSLVLELPIAGVLLTYATLGALAAILHLLPEEQP